MPTPGPPALLLALLLTLASCGSGGPGPPSSLAQLTVREQIGALLEVENMTVGAELGVQRGQFALQTLSHWPACRRYYLVDLWQPQDNYTESANVPLPQQERYLAEARHRLAPFNASVVYLRMFTTEAAKRIPDMSLDYVYIDARHDYCGVMEDLLSYWPKVRVGGIFAGHDFYFAGHFLLGKDDWSLCHNGERHKEAVKGAVVEFARNRSLSICVTRDLFPSWLIRKPGPGVAGE
eukprot:EG_transcript_27551